MRIILLFCNISSVFFAIISGSILRDQSDDDNLGEALFLTKYIEIGDIETARELALVSHPEILIESYAGYLTVNKEYNSNLYFWFFPAKVNPDFAPVLLWLQGGPGGPSVWMAINGNGPYNTKSGKLVPNEYSWHQDYNLLYVDNPVGAGFSFTDSEDGYSNNEEDVGQNVLLALQQFFLLFPKLQQNEFFASGVSYGGKYVHAIGYAIYQDSKRKTIDPQKPKINLKGLAIESGWIDPIHQFNFADLLYQLGLIDSNGHKLFVKEQNRAIDCVKNNDMECAYDVFNQFISGNYVPYPSLSSNLTGLTNYAHALQIEFDITPTMQFICKLETLRALHVGNHTSAWPISHIEVAKHLKFDFMDSVDDWVAELLSHYPILFYNGQLDIICSYTNLVNVFNHLKFSAAEEYNTAERHIWRVDNEVAGYVKQAGNLTEVLVRNAGHLAYIDQPKWVLDILLRFTQHKRFY